MPSGSYHQGPAPSGTGGSVIQSQEQETQETSGDLLESPTLPDAAQRSGNATLHVNVPADAKVFINGRETSSTGSARKYVSRNLQSGHQYRYQVRAVTTVNGQPREQVREINLRAGQVANLSFGSSEASAVANQQNVNEKVQTKLTVNAPAAAEVYLAGQHAENRGDQSQGSSSRTFVTKQLAAGESWANYTVKVVLEQNGKTLTKEQTLTLVGGQDREISLNFTEADVASVAAATSR